MPDDVLDAVAEGMAGLEDYFRDLAKVNGAEIAVHRRPANYPLPGYDGFGTVEVLSIPDFDARAEYPQVRGRLRGPNVFKLVHDNVRAPRHRGTAQHGGGEVILARAARCSAPRCAWMAR